MVRGRPCAPKRDRPGRNFLRRLNIFAKGNLDIHDTLHSLELNGSVHWNGINQAIRERGDSFTVRVRHETSLGSAAILEAPGAVPEVFEGRVLPLDPYPLSSQFGRTLFEVAADASRSDTRTQWTLRLELKL